MRLSVCSGSTKAAGVGASDRWDFEWTAWCDLSSAMSETVTLDLKNLSFMDSDGRIFRNPSVVHPTIIVFIPRRQYKAIELYEDGFRD